MMKSVIDRNFNKNLEVRYDLLNNENKNEANEIFKELKLDEVEEKVFLCKSPVFDENFNFTTFSLVEK